MYELHSTTSVSQSRRICKRGLCCVRAIQPNVWKINQVLCPNEPAARSAQHPSDSSTACEAADRMLRLHAGPALAVLALCNASSTKFSQDLAQNPASFILRKLTTHNANSLANPVSISEFLPTTLWCFTRSLNPY